MQTNFPLPIKLGGVLAARGIGAWLSTLDFRAAYYDRTVDPCRRSPNRRLYIFWHEYILFPLYLRGHCDLAMLLSRHRDADILARVAQHLGFHCVRGSTYRGASSAVRAMLRQGQQMHLAATPDGPRGPRRRLAQGSIYLASKLRMPLVPLGFGYDRPWRINSWDRFAVPRPFSRARGIAGPPIHVPADLDRAGIEAYRQGVERLLNGLTCEAEAWATSGTRKLTEVAVYPQTAPIGRRADRVATLPLSAAKPDPLRRAG